MCHADGGHSSYRVQPRNIPLDALRIAIITSSSFRVTHVDDLVADQRGQEHADLTRESGINLVRYGASEDPRPLCPHEPVTPRARSLRAHNFGCRSDGKFASRAQKPRAFETDHCGATDTVGPVGNKGLKHNKRNAYLGLTSRTGLCRILVGICIWTSCAPLGSCLASSTTSSLIQFV